MFRLHSFAPPSFLPADTALVVTCLSAFRSPWASVWGVGWAGAVAILGALRVQGTGPEGINIL